MATRAIVRGATPRACVTMPAGPTGRGHSYWLRFVSDEGRVTSRGAEFTNQGSDREGSRRGLVTHDTSFGDAGVAVLGTSRRSP